MSGAVYLPSDEFSGTGEPDLDLAADYLELKAIFSIEKQSFSQDIVDSLEISAEFEFHDVDDEMKKREEIANGAVARAVSRKSVLDTAYPFDFDSCGDTIFCTVEKLDLGQTAYLTSLLLSNLRAVSPLLNDSEIHPSDRDVRNLRQWFQYFATAALAAEIGGQAWSFGFPRPDQSGFIVKLKEIWDVLKDGNVEPHPSAPNDPKDDGIDVFAWREQKDGLPGFLLAAAQAATGRDWKDKSIQSRVDNVFPRRWFRRSPETGMVPYHIIPFARSDDKFPDDVRVLGNILHRLRIPLRVREAVDLDRKGVSIEAFDRLEEAAEWITSYVKWARRGR